MGRLRFLAGAVVVGALWLASGSPASGTAPTEVSATRAEAAALARQAVTDDEALAELRRIGQVDGTPVDLRAATADLGPDRAVRLTLLAESLAGPAGPDGAGADPARAREAARSVLEQQKFHAKEPPRPFKGLLEALARPVRAVGRALVRVLETVVEPILALPGGAYLLLAAVGLLVAGLVARLVSRRSHAVVVSASYGSGGLVDPDADPEQLDRAAEEAEATGDLAGAVRLRYEAGLVRLVRADRLDLRPETTPAAAARQVGDPTMDALTADFEQVVYGGRAATGHDVARSRAGWPSLLGVRSRR